MTVIQGFLKCCCLIIKNVSVSAASSSFVIVTTEVYFVCKAASQVSITRTPWRWGAAKDRRKLKGTKRLYLHSRKSDTASDGVIGTAIAMKSASIHTSHILITGSWGGQWHYWLRCPALAAGNIAVLSFLRGLWSGFVKCPWMRFSGRFLLYHRRLRPTLAAGDIYVFSRWRPCSCHALCSFAERTDLWCHNDTGDSILPQCHWFW